MQNSLLLEGVIEKQPRMEMHHRENGQDWPWCCMEVVYRHPNWQDSRFEVIAIGS